MISQRTEIPDWVIRLRYFGILALWGLFFTLILRDYFAYPYDSSQPYGQNTPGTLPIILTLMGVELVVLIAILRPQSYAESWRRMVLALLIFAPWTMLSFIATMHAGGIITLHTLWLLVLSASLLLLGFISVLTNLFRTKAQQPKPKTNLTPN